MAKSNKQEVEAMNGGETSILAPLLLAVAATVALAAIGFALKRRGKLRGRGAALGWAVLTVLPLFGSGAAMFVSHLADEASGRTKSGVSDFEARGAP
ncbi:hypothetical protein [Sphingomonas sp.]|uniref:hypothetical protein n=1 Tax=Sphingomonas sp. TaxID=28214 RepID=UPI002D8023B0|nr:hypothetical protein [Sphingomonas sp.]HEU0043212.1 hypothetical protein [Sphingomonas sp.]